METPKFNFISPEELAAQLNISGKRLRTILRTKYPRPPWEKGTRWAIPENVASEVVDEVRRLAYQLDPTKNKVLPRPPKLPPKFPGIEFIKLKW